MLYRACSCRRFERYFMLLISCIFIHSIHQPTNALNEILVMNCVFFFNFILLSAYVVDGFNVLKDSSAFIFRVS